LELIEITFLLELMFGLNHDKQKINDELI